MQGEEGEKRRGDIFLEDMIWPNESLTSPPFTSLWHLLAAPTPWAQPRVLEQEEEAQAQVG